MSEKHRHWAGALARNCGITMPTTEQPPRRRKRWGETPDSVKAAIRADYIKGMKWCDLKAKYGASTETVAKFTADLPRRIAPHRYRQPEADAAPSAVAERPVRKPGENKWQYGARVKQWMLVTDPDYRNAVLANQKRGMIKSWRRRKRLLEKTTPVPQPAIISEPAAAMPVGAVLPLPLPPRVGFWRSVGMMLGIVR